MLPEMPKSMMKKDALETVAYDPAKRRDPPLRMQVKDIVDDPQAL